jgi:hypothetical protein
MALRCAVNSLNCTVAAFMQNVPGAGAAFVFTLPLAGFGKLQTRHFFHSAATGTKARLVVVVTFPGAGVGTTRWFATILAAGILAALVGIPRIAMLILALLILRLLLVVTLLLAVVTLRSTHTPFGALRLVIHRVREHTAATGKRDGQNRADEKFQFTHDAS